MFVVGGREGERENLLRRREGVEEILTLTWVNYHLQQTFSRNEETVIHVFTACWFCTLLRAFPPSHQKPTSDLICSLSNL